MNLFLVWFGRICTKFGYYFPLFLELIGILRILSTFIQQFLRMSMMGTLLPIQLWDILSSFWFNWNFLLYSFVASGWFSVFNFHKFRHKFINKFIKSISSVYFSLALVFDRFCLFYSSFASTLGVSWIDAYMHYLYN